MWAQQIAVLGADWHIRVADLRGHDSIGAMAEAVLENAPSRFALAGPYMGGRVALTIMRLAPERIERLALLDTGARAAAADEPQQRQALVVLAWREGMKALHRELSPLNYLLRLRLNTPVDEDKMTAKLEDGVLSITLPLKEAAKPRQITVN